MQKSTLAKLILIESNVVRAVDDYLLHWSSSRISHHQTDLLTALIREMDDLEAEERKAGERAAEAAERLRLRGFDAHTKAMAARLDIEPEEFLRRQAERRQEMGL